jgi:tyrosinase
MRVAFLGAAIVAAATIVHAQEFVLEVNNTSKPADDYLCWTPIPARVRVATPGSAPAETSASVTGEAAGGGGEVGFDSQPERPTRDTFSDQSSLMLVIPGNGEWVSFWIAGRKASTAAKDVEIVVRNQQGTVISRVPVMVRVRKDAETLTSLEQNIYLDALRRLHGIPDESTPESPFALLARIHEASARLQIHRSPLFLPWHRALVLDLERQLQQIDPRVTVPYWRFDRPAPALFSDGFLGETRPDSPFESGSGLGPWVDTFLGKLAREPQLAPGGSRVVDELSVASFYQQYVIFHSQLESQYHTAAHAAIGGWLASPRSPADPLFYLLHSNVDRAWAHWQAQNDRFDPANELSYSAQGRYPGTGPDKDVYSDSVYAEDPMWPWNSGALQSEWPSISHSMPAADGSAAALPPTPASQVDFMDTRGKGVSLGYCYDDLGYRAKVINAPH